MRSGKGGTRPTYGTRRRVRADGYVALYEPSHPIAQADGYVAEHRKVAWDAGLLTDPEMHVHHRNGDKTDNRLENLEVLTAAEHQALHAPENPDGYNAYRRRRRAELGQRFCEMCEAEITALRIDATVCSERCRIRRWKARRRRLETAAT